MRGGRAVTPTLASGCLAGITRALALEWLDILEEDMPLAALADADEVLLLSSTRDIQPVTSVDGRAVDAGPVGRALREEFIARARDAIDP